jgi:hypothetical protein
MSKHGHDGMEAGDAGRLAQAVGAHDELGL